MKAPDHLHPRPERVSFWIEQGEHVGGNPSWCRRGAHLRLGAAQVDQARAAWSSLCAWARMPPPAAMGQGGADLLAAALALAPAGFLRQAMLAGAGEIALESDNAEAWRALIGAGHDPEAWLAIMEESGERGSAEHWQPVCGWLPRAAWMGSWRVGAILAGSPEGKVGVPMPGDEEEMSRERREWIQSQESESCKGWRPPSDLAWRADAWERQHPLLLAWRPKFREGEEEESPPPSAFLAALAAAGMGPQWGRSSFDAAAANLALKGSREAIAACDAAGVRPGRASLLCDKDWMLPF